MAGGLLGVPPTFGSVADSVLDVVPAAPAGSKPNTFGFGVLQPAKGGNRDFFGSVGSIISGLRTFQSIEPCAHCHPEKSMSY